MRRPLSLLIAVVLLAGVLPSAAFGYEPPARRKLQFPTDPAYLFVPLPYSMPGIGQGLFLMGYLSNMAHTTTDMAVVSTRGDANGLLAQLDELPVFSDHVHLQLFAMDINKANIDDYKYRGMDTRSDSYNLLEMTDVRQNSAELSLSYWDRRLEFTARYQEASNAVVAIRNAQGDLLTRFANPYVTKGINRSYGVLLDLTDDHQDPKRGLRLRLNYRDRPASTSDAADYYVLDYSLLYYLPVHNGDTLAFNYYRSDAYVRRIGQTDPAAVQASLGTTCTPTDQACLDAEAQRVQNIIDQNRYGTATPLGGTDRLRSYPNSRYSGAHSAFIGVELRSTFVQEATPFDYFIWRDISTGLQLALFGEAGTVAETQSDLWKDVRYSYGLGARLLSASGSVYRADWATGSEGSEFTVFFFYPWQ